MPKKGCCGGCPSIYTLDAGGSIASGSVVIAGSNGSVWIMIDAKCEDIS